MIYLIVSIEGGGNVPPVLNVVKQLLNKGHQVILLSEPWYKNLAESTGAKFMAFKEHFTKTDRTKDIFEDWKDKRNAFENVSFGPAEVLVRETIDAITHFKADVLLVDVVLPPALIAGEYMKIPTVCLFHMPEYLPASNRPPGGLGLVPGKGVLGRLRDKFLGMVFEKIFNKYLSKINAIRESLNLPKQKNVSDLFRNATLRLIQSSEAFDIPIMPKPANVLYTGPVLDDPDWVAAWQNPFEPDDKRPLVVVSLSSTFQNQKKQVANCIAALGTLNVRGLVTLGLAMETENFVTPANVKLVANASHAQVFPQADCVLCHGGHGTVMRALANGVPIVCMPMGRDQDDNAAKLVLYNLGIKISPTDDAAKISKAILKILNNPSYKQNAQAKGVQIVQDSKKDILVDALENIRNR